MYARSAGDPSAHWGTEKACAAVRTLQVCNFLSEPSSSVLAVCATVALARKRKESPRPGGLNSSPRWPRNLKAPPERLGVSAAVPGQAGVVHAGSYGGWVLLIMVLMTRSRSGRPSEPDDAALACLCRPETGSRRTATRAPTGATLLQSQAGEGRRKQRVEEVFLQSGVAAALQERITLPGHAYVA